MQVEPTKRLFTVADYHRMGEADILGPEDRTELIDGEIFQMAPITHRHAMCVTRALHFFTGAFHTHAIVSTQNPLQLNNYSEPLPDIALLKYRSDFYASEDKVIPEDTLLVIEISDTTLRFDIKTKLPRYAAAAIREVWIENLRDDELLVNRDLIAGSYTTSFSLRRGDSVSLSAFPDTVFKVDDLLGGPPKLPRE